MQQSSFFFAKEMQQSSDPPGFSQVYELSKLINMLNYPIDLDKQ
jgi:hypothetical protein